MLQIQIIKAQELQAGDQLASCAAVEEDCIPVISVRREATSVFIVVGNDETQWQRCLVNTQDVRIKQR